MIILALLAGALILLSACTNVSRPANFPEETLDAGESWRLFSFTDIRTGDSFVISDLDAPVLIERFTVGCLTCTTQQKNLHSLMLETNVSIVSLHTDPLDDISVVLGHIERNLFTGLFAISPAEITQNMVSEFGESIFTPDAPLVLLCESRKARILTGGLKSVDDLQFEILQGC